MKWASIRINLWASKIEKKQKYRDFKMKKSSLSKSKQNWKKSWKACKKIIIFSSKASWSIRLSKSIRKGCHTWWIISLKKRKNKELHWIIILRRKIIMWLLCLWTKRKFKELSWEVSCFNFLVICRLDQ